MDNVLTPLMSIWKSVKDHQPPFNLPVLGFINPKNNDDPITNNNFHIVYLEKIDATGMVFKTSGILHVPISIDYFQTLSIPVPINRARSSS